MTRAVQGHQHALADTFASSTSPTSSPVDDLVMMVRHERRCGAEISVETRADHISSTHTSAAHLLHSKLRHWRIENSLHWILDIAFREDESRVCKDHGAQNLAILRHIALNLLKQETTCKLGVFNKRLKAAGTWTTCVLYWQRCSNKTHIASDS